MRGRNTVPAARSARAARFTLALLFTALAIPCAGRAAGEPGPPLFDAGFYELAPQDGYGSPFTSSGIAVRDVNGDGNLDLMLVRRYPGSPVLEILLGRGDGSFRLGGDYPAGETGLAVADFDGDGHVDAAIGEGDASAVSVLFGAADGSFARRLELPIVAPRPHGSGTVPMELACADFDRDGRMDIVCTVPDTGAVLWRGHGDGTFDAPSFVGGFRALRLAVADFDRDGVPDLACAGIGSTDPVAAVLLGRGDVTFRVAPPLPDWPPPISIGAADLDGDGIPDLAMITSYFEMLWLQPGRGDGTFGPEVDVPTRTDPASGPSQLIELTVTDVDQDGRQDLVVAATDGWSQYALIYRGRGDGTFDGPERLFGFDSQRMAVGDLDGDGRLDLVGASGASIALANADGSFGVHHATATPWYPRGLAAGDLDHDGHLEIVVGADTLSVLHAVPGSASMARRDFASVPAWLGAGIADLDGDGWPDLLTMSLDGLEVLPALGAGAFGPPVIVPAVSWPVTADLDGDGRAELLFFTPGLDSLRVCRFVGTPTLTRIDTRALAGQARRLATGDLDGDGHLDVVVTEVGARSSAEAFLGRGDGTLQPAFGPSFDLPSDYTEWLAIRDLDGDGHQDIVSLDGHALTVCHGPVLDIAHAHESYPVWDAKDAVLADLDGDGLTDIAMMQWEPSTISVMLGGPGGTFGPRVDYGLDGPPCGLAAADVNGDGALDLVVSLPDSNRVQVLLNRGRGGVVPVAAALAELSAAPGLVRLTWSLAGGATLATLYRAEGAAWRRLEQRRPDGAGRVTFEDRSVSPGRYRYRLGYASAGGGEAFTSEVLVDVPATASFALESPRPNPAVGAAAIELSLPDAAPAALELVDVAGRVVLRREVGALGAGRHRVALGDGARLAPGVYVVRLRRGAETLTRRLVALR